MIQLPNPFSHVWPEVDNKFNICYTPSSPNISGEFATPIYTQEQLVEYARQMVEDNKKRVKSYTSANNIAG